MDRRRRAHKSSRRPTPPGRRRRQVVPLRRAVQGRRARRHVRLRLHGGAAADVRRHPQGQSRTPSRQRGFKEDAKTAARSWRSRGRTLGRRRSGASSSRRTRSSTRRRPARRARSTRRPARREPGGDKGEEARRVPGGLHARATSRTTPATAATARAPTSTATSSSSRSFDKPRGEGRAERPDHYEELEDELRKAGNPWTVFQKRLWKRSASRSTSRTPATCASTSRTTTSSAGSSSSGRWTRPARGPDRQGGGWEGGGRQARAVPHAGVRRLRPRLREGDPQDAGLRHPRDRPHRHHPRTVGGAEVEALIAFLDNIVSQTSAERILRGVNTAMRRDEHGFRGDPWVFSGTRDNPGALTRWARANTPPRRRTPPSPPLPRLPGRRSSIPTGILALQQTIGNAAVGRLLQRRVHGDHGRRRPARRDRIRRLVRGRDPRDPARDPATTALRPAHRRQARGASPSRG